MNDPEFLQSVLQVVLTIFNNMHNMAPLLVLTLTHNPFNLIRTFLVLIQTQRQYARPWALWRCQQYPLFFFTSTSLWWYFISLWCWSKFPDVNAHIMPLALLLPNVQNLQITLQEEKKNEKKKDEDKKWKLSERSPLSVFPKSTN